MHTSLHSEMTQRTQPRPVNAQQPLDDSVKNAMAGVSFAILMFALQTLCGFATSATLGRSSGNASSAVGRASRMHTVCVNCLYHL